VLLKERCATKQQYAWQDITVYARFQGKPSVFIQLVVQACRKLMGDASRFSGLRQFFLEARPSKDFFRLAGITSLQGADLKT